MEIKSESEEGVLIVSVSGRVDAMSCLKLEAVLTDHIGKGARKLIVDLNDVLFISSAGLRVILLITQQLYGKGKIIISRPLSTVKEVLEKAGFDTIMPIHASLEAAREEMSR